MASRLKDILFETLEMVLSGDATPTQVEQVCYLSEQVIKDDKNTIEVEKARMYMEIEREERLQHTANQLAATIEKVNEHEQHKTISQ